MQVFSHGCPYLNRDSLESQISFCFTVFQENSSSSKAKRVRTVILHLFNHVVSFFRPWTKRMQYPILENKVKNGKGTVTFQYSSLHATPFSITFLTQLLFCFFFFLLIILSKITNMNSAAFFLKSLHNFQINLNDRPRCQKYSSVHNPTQRNGSLHHSVEGSCLSQQQASKASCNNSNTERYQREKHYGTMKARANNPSGGCY